MRRSIVLLLAFALWVPWVPLQAQDLLAVYDLALKNDPKLREAERRRDSVKERRVQARALLLPNIGLSGSAERIDRDNHSRPDDNYGQNTLALNLKQPLYHRDYWLQLEQADSAIAQAEAEYAAARLDLMLRTATAYFNVLGAQDDLKFRTAEREATGRQLEQAKQRYDVGLIAITDVHEAQAAHDGARANEIQAQTQLDNAWEELREIIGNTDVPLARLGEHMALTLPDPQDIDKWAEMALKQNYAIVAAAASVDALKKDIEIKRSGHYPTLDLVGAYSAFRSSSDSAFSGDNDTTNLGLQLNLPLYAGGAVTSKTRQARFDYQAAQEALDQQRRAVNRQVRDAYRGVLSNISRVKALKAATLSAESALESTQAGFDVGTRTMVDVLNVQRNLFEARAKYARSRYDYILNALRLRQAASLLGREDLERVNAWLEDK